MELCVKKDDAAAIHLKEGKMLMVGKFKTRERVLNLFQSWNVQLFFYLQGIIIGNAQKRMNCAQKHHIIGAELKA